MQNENLEHIGILESLAQSERTKYLLGFAKHRGLEDSRVYCPDGTEHSAAKYAVQLCCNAITIADAPSEQSDDYLAIALLITMERTRKDNWTYGTKLLTDLANAEYALTPQEILTLQVMNPALKTSQRNALMKRQWLPTVFYCADLATRLGSMAESKDDPLRKGEMSQEMFEKFNSCQGANPQETVENLMLTFIPAYLKEESVPAVKNAILRLRSDGFFTCPVDHLRAPGYLAIHTLNTCWRLVMLRKAENEAVIGECVLAAIGHDTAELKSYQAVFENVKQYTNEGKEQEPDGRRYNWAKMAKCVKVPGQVPEHGRRSAYYWARLFPRMMPETICAAIDAHEHDVEENPEVDFQMMEYPLGLYLHIADTIAKCIDDVRRPEN